MHSIRLSFLLIAFVFVSCSSMQDSPPVAERPNILFIIADDASRNSMSIYGSKYINTPHFDRLAKEGVLFNNAFSNNPKCAPARASLLPVFLIVLVDVFGMTLVIPLLAIYAETFGATPLQATLLVSVFAVCMLLSGPLIGHASDRYGRKPLLIISQRLLEIFCQ